jgi:hypothetical protein
MPDAGCEMQDTNQRFSCVALRIPQPAAWKLKPVTILHPVSCILYPFLYEIWNRRNHRKT